MAIVTRYTLLELVVALAFFSVVIKASSSIVVNNTYPSFDNDIYVNTRGGYGLVLLGGNISWVAHSVIWSGYSITWNTTFNIDPSTPTLLLTSVEQYDSHNSTAIIVHSGSTVYVPNTDFIDITVLQNVDGTLFLSLVSPLNSVSVVGPSITNMYYLPVVTVVSNTWINTESLSLSGMCALATDIPAMDQVVPAGGNIVFVLSFAFAPKSVNASVTIPCNEYYGAINFYPANESHPISTITFTAGGVVVTAYDENNQLQSQEFCDCSTFQPTYSNESTWSLLVVPPYLYLSMGMYLANEPYGLHFLLSSVIGTNQFVPQVQSGYLWVGAAGAVTNVTSFPIVAMNQGGSNSCSDMTLYQIGLFVAALVAFCTLLVCILRYRLHRASGEREKLIQQN